MGQLSETLITDDLVDEFIVVLGEKLAPMNAFAVRATGGPLALKESGIAGYLLEKSGTRPSMAEVTAATDTVDFQASVATNDAISLNTKHYWASADIRYAEQLAGIPFKTAVPVLVDTISEAIWDEVDAIVTTNNFGTAVTVNADSLTVDLLQTMWGSAKLSADASVITTRVNYVNLLPNDLDQFQLRTNDGATAFGLNGNIYFVDDIGTGDAQTETWVLDKEAIVGVQGLPQQAPQVAQSQQISETTITEPMSGFSFMLAEWVDPQTKSVWMTISCVAGFTVGDGTAMVRGSTDGL